VAKVTISETYTNYSQAGEMTAAYGTNPMFYYIGRITTDTAALKTATVEQYRRADLCIGNDSLPVIYP
jgi:hypothetical protein